MGEPKLEKSALGNVVGFTDPSGRTSCAKNETEHYRLRCLALVRISSAAEKEFKFKEYSAEKLKHIIEGRMDGDNRDVLLTDPSASNLESYKCEIAELLSTAEASRKKFRLAELALGGVMRYIAPAQLTYPNAMLQKLPRDIRNLIYEQIFMLDKGIYLKQRGLGIFYERDSNSFSYTPMNFLQIFINDPNYDYGWDNQACIDPDIVGHGFATEIVQTVYRVARFQVYELDVLQRFLAKGLWKTFEDVVVPTDFIRHLEISVKLPVDDILASVHPSETIVRKLEPLLQISQEGATITLHFDFSIPTLDSAVVPPETLSVIRAQMDCYEDWLPDDFPNLEFLQGHLMEWFGGNAALLSFFGCSMPFIQELWKRGHVVVFKGFSEGWTCTPNKNFSELDAVLLARSEAFETRFWKWVDSITDAIPGYE